MMKKEQYESTRLEMIRFSSEDVITTSDPYKLPFVPEEGEEE